MGTEASKRYKHDESRTQNTSETQGNVFAADLSPSASSTRNLPTTISNPSFCYSQNATNPSSRYEVHQDEDENLTNLQKQEKNDMYTETMFLNSEDLYDVIDDALGPISQKTGTHERYSEDMCITDVGGDTLSSDDSTYDDSNGNDRTVTEETETQSDVEKRGIRTWTRPMSTKSRHSMTSGYLTCVNPNYHFTDNGYPGMTALEPTLLYPHVTRIDEDDMESPDRKSSMHKMVKIEEKDTIRGSDSMPLSQTAKSRSKLSKANGTFPGTVSDRTLELESLNTRSKVKDEEAKIMTQLRKEGLVKLTENFAECRKLKSELQLRELREKGILPMGDTQQSQKMCSQKLVSHVDKFTPKSTGQCLIRLASMVSSNIDTLDATQISDDSYVSAKSSLDTPMLTSKSQNWSIINDDDDEDAVFNHLNLDLL